MLWAVTTLVVMGLLALAYLARRPKEAEGVSITVQMPRSPGAILMMHDYYLEGARFFNLVSKNQGGNWQVMELFEDKDPVVLGDVTAIHPIVLRDREAWQALQDYVLERGSIKLNDRRGVRLLRRCGFEVRLKL